MPRCHLCRLVCRDQELIHCKICGQKYCFIHKESRNHNCKLALEKNMLQSIIKKYKEKEISRAEMEDYLITQLEQDPMWSYNFQIMELFEQFELKSERIYRLLESYLISDWNSISMGLAAKTLITLFPENCSEPLNWVIDHHEDFYDVLAVIYDLLLDGHVKYAPKLQAAITNIFKPKNLYYINEGVAPREAPILSLIQIQFQLSKLIKAKPSYKYKNVSVNENQYSINDEGQILGVYSCMHDFGPHLTHPKGIIFIPKSLHFLNKLEILSHKHHTILVLYNTLGNMKSLNIINLFDNLICSIPETIGQLKNLRELYLGTNTIQSLPDSIGQLKELKVLDLSSNDLKTLPPSLGQLKKLEVLNLHGNEIEVLPDDIGALISLKKLDISFNNLRQIPQAICKLPALEDLNISGNYIHEIPDNIKALRSKGVRIYC